ncbi:hypothetical protein D3C71_1641030 [compost metagenome]
MPSQNASTLINPKLTVTPVLAPSKTAAVKSSMRPVTAAKMKPMRIMPSQMALITGFTPSTERVEQRLKRASRRLKPATRLMRNRRSLTACRRLAHLGQVAFFIHRHPANLLSAKLQNKHSAKAEVQITAACGFRIQHQLLHNPLFLTGPERIGELKACLQRISLHPVAAFDDRSQWKPIKPEIQQ